MMGGFDVWDMFISRYCDFVEMKVKNWCCSVLMWFCLFGLIFLLWLICVFCRCNVVICDWYDDFVD